MEKGIHTVVIDTSGYYNEDTTRTWGDMANFIQTKIDQAFGANVIRVCGVTTLRFILPKYDCTAMPEEDSSFDYTIYSCTHTSAMTSANHTCKWGNVGSRIEANGSEWINKKGFSSMTVSSNSCNPIASGVKLIISINNSLGNDSYTIAIGFGDSQVAARIKNVGIPTANIFVAKSQDIITKTYYNMSVITDDYGRVWIKDVVDNFTIYDSNNYVYPIIIKLQVGSILADGVYYCGSSNQLTFNQYSKARIGHINSIGWMDGVILKNKVHLIIGAYARNGTADGTILVDKDKLQS